MEHAVERTDVPYKKGTVPVMHCRAKGEWLVDLSGFFDILLADDPKALRIIMDSMYRHGHAGVFNKRKQGFTEMQQLR
jgi:hypothetical protein